MAVKDTELAWATPSATRNAPRLILADYPKESLVDMDPRATRRHRGRIPHEGQDPNRRLRVRPARALHKGLGVRPVVSAPGDALSYVMDIKDQQREHFKTLFLNARNQVVHSELTSIGSLVQCHRPPPRGLPVGRPVPRRVRDLGPQPPLRRRVAIPRRHQPHPPPSAGRRDPRD